MFLLLASCLTVMWAIGYIRNLSSDSWLLKGCLLLILLVGMALSVRQFVGVKNLRYLPTALMLSSVFWMSVTWFFWFMPDVTNAIVEIPVMFSLVGLLYFFYKAWRTDPGYIKSSEKDKKENIAALAEAGCLDFRTFCTSCLVRKPLRSVHCVPCDSCVARYDQHSLWIAQCTGVGNHHYYLLFLSSLTVTSVWLLYRSLLFLDASRILQTSFNADVLVWSNPVELAGPSNTTFT